MSSLWYEFQHNVPLFRCDHCGQCEQHIEAINGLHINRGCCWYFPTYELVDIKNILANGQQLFIHELVTKPQVLISRYQIQVGGKFEKEKYNCHLKAQFDQPKTGFDESLRFRLCSLFGENGCTINADLRPHPCNLYLCREVIAWAGPTYYVYQQERKDYFAYCAYINEILRSELVDHGFDLVRDLNGALEVIATCEIPLFQPSQLPLIPLIVPKNPLSA